MHEGPELIRIHQWSRGQAKTPTGSRITASYAQYHVICTNVFNRPASYAQKGLGDRQSRDRLNARPADRFHLQVFKSRE